MSAQNGVTTIHQTDMIYQIAFRIVLGLPLIAWGGVATLISLLATATLGYLFHTGKAVFPFVWHIRAALTTLAIALIHGSVAMLALLGF